MNVFELNIPEDYYKCTNIENEDKTDIFKYLLFPIPRSILKISLISLMIYALIKPLSTTTSLWRKFIPNSSS